MWPSLGTIIPSMLRTPIGIAYLESAYSVFTSALRLMRAKQPWYTQFRCIKISHSDQSHSLSVNFINTSLLLSDSVQIVCQPMNVRYILLFSNLIYVEPLWSVSIQYYYSKEFWIWGLRMVRIITLNHYLLCNVKWIKPYSEYVQCLFMLFSEVREWSV